jgi:hypothetical protein
VNDGEILGQHDGEANPIYGIRVGKSGAKCTLCGSALRLDTDAGAVIGFKWDTLERRVGLDLLTTWVCRRLHEGLGGRRGGCIE